MPMDVSASWMVLMFMCSPILGDLHHSLHSYETLHFDDFKHHIVKRSVQSPGQLRQLDITTLGRHFSIYLQPNSRILASDFKAYAVKGDGKKTSIPVDPRGFYRGHVSGETHSEVHAYWEDNALNAVIKTPQDTYIIEPSWRFLPPSSNYTMIAYKGSDVKMAFDKNHTHDDYCQSVHPPDVKVPGNWSDDIDESAEEVHSREKRAPYSPSKNTCPLGLVADYKFFVNMGKKNLWHTTNYLIGLVGRVDEIYRNTEFDGTYKGFGFEIKEITVHQEETKVAKGDTHYNMPLKENQKWDTKELLTSFSKGDQHKRFCLHHLFTYYKFDGGVLGLAYIASPRRYSVGGICTSSFFDGGTTFSLNSGWSSSLNRYDKRILTSEADLVTAHEFGHNWGSEHDPEGDECSPSPFQDGKYIMYPYSVSGYDPNNKHFSPCSRRNIAAVLRSKSAQCFVKYVPVKPFCGNNMVEPGEQCDGGLVGQNDQDKCCDMDCKLRPYARCSDMNDVCCKGCRIAPKGEVCHQATAVGITCEGSAECTGRDKECPEPGHMPDTSPCVDNGTCRAGKCNPYCVEIGLEPCACDTVEDACKICCKASGVNDSCQPPAGKTLYIRNGRPCIQGFCENGKCEKQVEDVVVRFWNLIEHLTIDMFVKIMRDNLVGTIIVLSIILWVPASCIFSYCDRKRRKEEDDIVEWHSGKNTGLIPGKEHPKFILRKAPEPRRATGSIVRTHKVMAAPSYERISNV